MAFNSSVSTGSAGSNAKQQQQQPNNSVKNTPMKHSSDFDLEAASRVNSTDMMAAFRSPKFDMDDADAKMEEVMKRLSGEGEGEESGPNEAKIAALERDLGLGMEVEVGDEAMIAG